MNKYLSFSPCFLLDLRGFLEINLGLIINNLHGLTVYQQFTIYFSSIPIKWKSFLQC